MIDLRSDTVTRPTARMRRAMADAEVGDDQYGEDPTVNALQEAFAERLGKPAALYVPSGTMANQIALLVSARPGDGVIAAARSHVVLYEHGAGGANAGVVFIGLDDADGMLAAEDVSTAVAGAEHHHPRPAALFLENTHMAAGGVPWDTARLAGVAAASGDAGLAIHLDGARLWHAEVATGVTVADLAAPARTVMCCLSKGLAGPADLIEAAVDLRYRLGGAMRQAGIIAAAGLVALVEMIPRLADDHARAARLAEAVAERWPEAGVDPAAVRTNVVVFRHDDPAKLIAHLAGEGIAAGTIAPRTVRLVTHADIDDGEVDQACRALASGP